MSCLELQLIQLRGQGQGSTLTDTELIPAVTRAQPVGCEWVHSNTLSTLQVEGEGGREEQKRKGGEEIWSRRWLQNSVGGSGLLSASGPPPLTRLLGLCLVCSGVVHSRTNHCHMAQDFWRAKQLEETSFLIHFPTGDAAWLLVRDSFGLR